MKKSYMDYGLKVHLIYCFLRVNFSELVIVFIEYQEPNPPSAHEQIPACSQVLNLLGLSSSERGQHKAGSGWGSSPAGPPSAPVVLPDLLDDWDASGEFDKAQVLRKAFCEVIIF